MVFLTTANPVEVAYKWSDKKNGYILKGLRDVKTDRIISVPNPRCLIEALTKISDLCEKE